MQNHDLFTKQELLTWSHRDSKMQNDVGNNKPIKIRPCRTPIRNREVIDKAIDKMLDSDDIQRSKSP